MCVYCHDLDRSHAINDVTKKKITHSLLVDRLNASMIKPKKKPPKKNLMEVYDAELYGIS